MKQLSQVLQDISNFSMPSPIAPPLTPQPGSTKSDGQSITTRQSPNAGEQAPRVVVQLQPVGLVRPSESSRKIGNRDEADIERFTITLGQACVLLKQYGKAISELRTLRDGYLHFLPEFSVAEILDALEIHISQTDTMPTVRELRAILDPSSVVWKPDWAYYTALKRKVSDEQYFLYSDEREYLRRCEEHSLDKLKQQG